MDPFIENQEWSDFHVSLIVGIRESLVPKVAPRYVVRAERRVYVEHVLDENDSSTRPDVTILDSEGESPGTAGGVAVAVDIQPRVLTLPMPETQREAYLLVRERDTMEVVTVIEVLSAGNKRPGSDGRREYLSKREEVHRSRSHLVELDLLRGGDRLPTVETLPKGDHYAFVSRSKRRPREEVYAWPLPRPLPTIPVPLAGDDPDVPLDLQEVFDTVYDRAAYHRSINYARPLDPPLGKAGSAWLRQVLKRGRPK
jgi:hypothetical protein